MSENFVTRHPYLFTFFVLPAAFYGVAQVVRAVRGEPEDTPEPQPGTGPGTGPSRPIAAPSWPGTGPATAAADAWRLPLSAQPLTPIRRQAMAALKDVLPAKNGGGGKLQANADAIGPTDPATIASLPKGFSNCGALPGWLSRALGLSDGGTQSGTEGVRTRAKARGAWVDAEPGLPVLPKPGDIYALSDGPRGSISHVGVIVDIAKNPDGTYSLTTADAGQGTFPNWEANFVTRSLDIDGPKSTYLNRTRYIVGWLDLDKWPKN